VVVAASALKVHQVGSLQARRSSGSSSSSSGSSGCYPWLLPGHVSLQHSVPHLLQLEESLDFPVAPPRDGLGECGSSHAGRERGGSGRGSGRGVWQYSRQQQHLS